MAKKKGHLGLIWYGFLGHSTGLIPQTGPPCSLKSGLFVEYVVVQFGISLLLLLGFFFCVDSSFFTVLPSTTD